MLKFLFAMVLAITAVVAINTLFALPLHRTGPIFQPVFQKVY
jgi:hypothetical protein